MTTRMGGLTLNKLFYIEFVKQLLLTGVPYHGETNVFDTEYILWSLHHGDKE